MGIAILIACIAVLALLAWFDRRQWRQWPRPPLSRTEEALRAVLRSIGIDVSPEEIADLTHEEFDQAWVYADAMAGGSAQSTTDPVMPVCVRRLGRRYQAGRPATPSPN